MRNKINLTKNRIPAFKEESLDYYFYIDCEGHQKDPRVAVP